MATAGGNTPKWRVSQSAWGKDLINIGQASFHRIVADFSYSAVGTAAKGGGSLWQLPPFARGSVIETQLGANLPRGFPVIDRFQNGVATSIKSINLAAPTYQDAATLARTVKRYVDTVAAYQGHVRPWGGVAIPPGQITAREFQLAIPGGNLPAAQQAVLHAAAQRAQRLGVQLTVTPIP